MYRAGAANDIEAQSARMNESKKWEKAFIIHCLGGNVGASARQKIL